MKKVLAGLGLYAIPFLALAQGTGTLVSAVNTIGKIVNLIIPIVGAVLLVFFFYGVIGYVNAGGEDEKRTAARNTMIYAVIGMFVAFSIFGLIQLLQRSFGVGDTAGLTLPGQSGFFNF
ncbi:MAG: hypothetical protein A3C08_01485 [Candidatus Taylorbacteria bacterium RIFCSPHIGHO2_02_FULL_47_18]|uniref:TrbC/VirB2 family protein n=1 Tax=Candidatus Taylorbacteria bacterium RIFCSPLOWO2_01_FULL_48_100 TaxID=1802322 RepID=A0A1G2NGC5_9BACT|nr:MAG: hypothetical protein A2670_01505 [Candidatus Taylorbacteria bacterium RIFCSPHIGHO2_01_FULL_48_38]OHA28426.1 MAG: hypothetical protein A3C08_01485 [Candidatus Taylorbacteria bacterium RIFCSPHIGHO2_02_FULL_47_18]OHA34392.1 MAG: hypothetical protein A2938_00885 [Candidatus Taylorbacteria bacterium RIFCSPLOWO2_01_FULL_48_100]OHA40181.1 MAG: hypothetical protein A3J31_01195 [Candidatus Taylorbacteria bacterium RIFCSPLOWO2_02_FULL_48_16]OHA45484.1 MAG: hypothetical protein A3H13_01650 [Candid